MARQEDCNGILVRLVQYTVPIHFYDLISNLMWYIYIAKT